MSKFTTAIVTGAGHLPGIGSQIALDLLIQGCNVAIISRSIDAEWYRLSSQYSNLLLYVGDITDRVTQRNFLKNTIELFGNLTYLVHNASSGPANYDENGYLTDDTWIDNFNINVMTVYNFSNLCRPYLKETKGAIVSISSRAASMNKVGNNLAYSVSKAALLKLTQELAVNFGPEITVNAISPAFVDTARLRKVFGKDFETLRMKRSTNSPTKQTVTVEDVSNVVRTTLTTRAINGQNISVCAGASLSINNV